FAATAYCDHARRDEFSIRRPRRPGKKDRRKPLRVLFNDENPFITNAINVRDHERAFALSRIVTTHEHKLLAIRRETDRRINFLQNLYGCATKRRNFIKRALVEVHFEDVIDFVSVRRKSDAIKADASRWKYQLVVRSAHLPDVKTLAAAIAQHINDVFADRRDRRIDRVTGIC